MSGINLCNILTCFALLSVLGSFSLNLQAQDFFTVGNNRVNDGRFNQNGFLKVNGTARLIIGLYELPKDDETLRVIADNGFNLVRVPQDTAALDRVHKHELYGWICLGSTAKLDKNDDKTRQKLSQIVDKFKKHPALLVWELPDEAVWNVWWSRFHWIAGGQQHELRKHIEQAKAHATEADVARWLSMLGKAQDYDARGLWKQSENIYQLLWEEVGVKNPHPDWRMSQCPADVDKLTDAIARGCHLIRQLDPEHIIWQNHAPRNSIRSLRKYNQAVDAVGCDIYPVPSDYSAGHSDLKDITLSSVGAYTDRMRKAAPGKSIWMVLQGFGWRDLNKQGKDDSNPAKGRRPHFRETRFMAYDAIVHGANAILYWGTHYIEKDSTLWQDLMRTAREIRALEPAIVGERPVRMPRAFADETYGSIDDQGPVLMACKAGRHWVLIAVNEYSQGISFTIKDLPEELEGKTLYRLYSDEMHVVKNRSIRDGIRGFDVHVYATTRRFESPGLQP